MNNKTTNKLPFKVKCTDAYCANLTVGKEYDVVEVAYGFYKVRDDNGEFEWYCDSRFEIVETPKDKQEIVSEIALQLLPTVYDKAIESFENSGSVYYGHWTDNVVAESFKLAEAYYNYKEKYLKG